MCVELAVAIAQRFVRVNIQEYNTYSGLNDLMHSPRNITPSFTYTTSEEIVNSFRPVSGAIQTRLLASPRIGRHTDGGDQIIDRQIVQNTINHTSSKRPKLTY